MYKYNALIGLACLTIFSSTTALAEGYSTDGYGQVTYSTQTPTPPPPPPRHHKHSDEQLAISINVNDAAEQFVRHGSVNTMVISKKRPHHHKGNSLEWVTIDRGDPLPSDIVTGGYQSRPPATLYICRAPYRGGAHPGKVFHGACNFSWGGDEIVVTSRYEVLTSRHALHWAAGSYGSVPPFAIEGGYQHDGPLYICQARYRGGMHPGKLYKEACLIGWGGREVAIPEYYVLTK